MFVHFDSKEGIDLVFFSWDGLHMQDHCQLEIASQKVRNSRKNAKVDRTDHQFYESSSTCAKASISA